MSELMEKDPEAGVRAAAFQAEPRPLLIETKKIVVSWSPKSACSHIVLWAFKHEGLFRACNYYNPWPHHYRLDVYYKSYTYQRRTQEFFEANGAGHTLVKFTRDPAKRLVSIFRHACRFPFLHEEVRRHLGFDMRREGLSLQDFGAVLARLNLVIPTSINPHVRAQIHPVWSMDFDRVVTINMDEVPLDATINRLEPDVGLSVTRFAEIPKFGHLRNAHYAKDVPFEGDDAALAAYRFRPRETDSFPKRRLEALPLVRELAERHYGVDYPGVASADTAGRLFA
jgi:hypothetical protein